LRKNRIGEPMRQLESIDQVEEALRGVGYVSERSLSTAIFLALKLKKPLFLEGEPGVGKTDVAVRLAELFSTRLIRLQCYEGIDAASALYDWDYPRQLLFIRMHEGSGLDKELMARGLYDKRFLIRRPLLEAIWNEEASPPVLLIDEVDRSDEEFEAFLLEVLADFQVTIPEIGTIKAKQRPFVVITSNRTRDVHDALKRRCLYHWIDYPSEEKEYQILLAHIPDLEERLARQLVKLIQAIRKMELLKKPGISETIDWARSLLELNKKDITLDVIDETMGCVLKYREDHQFMRESGLRKLEELLTG
jgi:MoxR-like ATPase